MCFMKGLQTLIISTKVGFVKTILLNVKKNCHEQNLLDYLVHHLSKTKYLLPFKSNVPRKIVFRNQLKKQFSNYAISLSIFEYTSQ